MRYLFLLTVLLMLGVVSLKAQENGNPSERTTPLEGDLNHDLKVDVADVTYLVNLIMNKKSEDGLRQYADRPAGGYENFLVRVNTGIDNNSNPMIGDLQKDRCIINLPVNYSATGNPVRLVIANFCTSGKITSKTTKAYNTLPHVDALLAEGYAVMQVNGTPGHTDGKSSGSLGTPAFLQCVQAAYEYVTKKYNIKKDGVFLSGWSQGTLKAWQIAANKIIPVKAMALFGFCSDLWKMMYAYISQSDREWMCEQFGFVEKEANKYGITCIITWNQLY